jgi:hypothetical protein
MIIRSKAFWAHGHLISLTCEANADQDGEIRKWLDECVRRLCAHSVSRPPGERQIDAKPL